MGHAVDAYTVYIIGEYMYCMANRVCVSIYIYIHIYRYIYMYTLLSDFAVCTMLYARRPLGIYAISQGRNCRELYTIEQYSVDTPSLFEDELCFKLR